MPFAWAQWHSNRADDNPLVLNSMTIYDFYWCIHWHRTFCAIDENHDNGWNFEQAGEKTNYLNPEIALSRDDLPAPDGPIIADNWPFLKTPLTLCSKHFFFESVTAIKYNGLRQLITISHIISKCSMKNHTKKQNELWLRVAGRVFVKESTTRIQVHTN